MFLFSIFLCILSIVFAQENAGTNIAPSLQICYNTTRYATRDYLLPATINVLVELIRKIEDGNRNQNARELSTEILQRFHQDGIQKTSKNIDSSLGIPYSPKGVEAFKNRVLLKKIIPGNAINFNNDSLSDFQKCSLHYMTSSSIEKQFRGDEAQTCRRSSRYTSRIQKREAEVFSETDKSNCPIENGVIYTKWGNVKGGLLLTGIAAGLNPNPLRQKGVVIETAYASTLAGELSETLLNQGTAEKRVGNKGGWNSSIEQKYYFLESNDKYLYFTDAEIRGSIDGLFLALNLPSWNSQVGSDLKISQILDLYYTRGVFNSSARACNRKKLFENGVTDSKLINQTVAFSLLLDPESQLSYTVKEDALPGQAQSVVTTWKSYLSSNLKDLECSAEESTSESTVTDVLIFIDSSWTHSTIQPLVSFILENLDINRYESVYTILNGANCKVIVNKTSSILDFYEYFNLTEQQKYPTGFDYNKVLDTSEILFKQKLNNKTDVRSSSQIILMLPHNTPTDSQNSYVNNKKISFKFSLPDVRIIVGGSGTKTSYNHLVTNAMNDIIEIGDNSSPEQLKISANSIIDRFRKIPRSIVNPECGSTFSTTSAQNFETINYVEPLTINYHKISPHYFFDGQSLKIKGQGYGTITVCTSRMEPNGLENTTGVTCNQLNSEEKTIDIKGYCNDDPLSCEPIYITVKGESSTLRCREQTCRFPDNIKYNIALENVHCSKSSEKILVPAALLSILLFIIMQF